ncbi:MAG TPA: MBL fold metallo-hydrolase [Thermoanaerobaculia bacterium]|nr:MBL fold metallo-hydrolase [Thermoanaerobaculia bacterium]
MGLYLIETFPVGPLQCNCAIIADPTTREAVVVDPGDEPDRILEALSGAGLRAVALIHTHAHFDHAGSSALLKRITGAPILMHAGDRPLYQNLTVQGQTFGLSLDAPGIIDRTLVGGDRVACGKSELEVIHTPGHTPGSLCFRMPGEGGDVLFSGDTLFRRSIGRTDLWGGSQPQILESIRDRLLTLPGGLRVVPGHGEETTIADEGRKNPFVGDPNYRPL